MGRLDGKKVLLVIASRNFRDEEYAQPRKILEGEGTRVTVAASATAPATGMLGMTVRPDLLLRDADASDYDAVVFVGGSGAGEYWEDPTAHALATAAAGAGRIVGAICIAPVTLANAGLLKGKRATVWPDCLPQLKAKGATTVETPVARDGRIVTGNGPEAASEFGKVLVEALAEA